MIKGSSIGISFEPTTRTRAPKRCDWVIPKWVPLGLSAGLDSSHNLGCIEFNSAVFTSVVRTRSVLVLKTGLVLKQLYNQMKNSEGDYLWRATTHYSRNPPPPQKKSVISEPCMRFHCHWLKLCRLQLWLPRVDIPGRYRLNIKSNGWVIQQKESTKTFRNFLRNVNHASGIFTGIYDVVLTFKALWSELTSLADMDFFPQKRRKSSPLQTTSKQLTPMRHMHLQVH